MPRDEKLLSPAEVDELLSGPVVVEEKLDGANLGFSLAPDGGLRAQNRGQYLIEPHGGQFRPLPQWMALHEIGLRKALGEHLIAFGEWCAVRHSLGYSSLADWWLLFDVYDRRTEAFWTTRRRDALARKLQLAVVPRLAAARVRRNSEAHCAVCFSIFGKSRSFGDRRFLLNPTIPIENSPAAKCRE